MAGTVEGLSDLEWKLFPVPARSRHYHIKRFNNTLRQRVSRLVRETVSFSKKLANHIGAIKYFICHYNLTRAAALHG
jgi:IS1 transposase